MTPAAEPNAALAALTLPQLAELREQYAAEATAVRAQLAVIGTELNRRYGPEWLAAFNQQNKVSGEFTLEREGVKLKGAIGKTVKWDSAKLMAIASAMPWDEAARLFKIEFSMTETAFKGVPEGELRAKLIDARTVAYSPLSISIQPKESPK